MSTRSGGHSTSTEPRRPHPVVIADYDAAWPGQFERLAARVRQALGDLCLDVHHVGSTAVSGLPAKPIIDLDAVVPPESMAAAIARLEELGYRHEGDHGIAGREAFRWPAAEPRHHLYVCAAGSRELSRHLRLRDRLRTDAAARQRYAAAKRAAAARHPDDSWAYTEAKTAVIEALLDSE